jgi:hypothetical protein
VCLEVVERSQRLAADAEVFPQVLDVGEHHEVVLRPADRDIQQAAGLLGPADAAVEEAGGPAGPSTSVEDDDGMLAALELADCVNMPS